MCRKDATVVAAREPDDALHGRAARWEAGTATPAAHRGAVQPTRGSVSGRGCRGGDGRRLYAESIELIRELVNNAYDADATEVRVTVGEDLIQVEDNGAGMDLTGLEQYFNIGSPEKLQKPKSLRFHRDRIGQFGIGKFASLSACGRFEVETQQGEFAARVIFDKSAWEEAGESWHLPLEHLAADPRRGNGTTVTLLQLTRLFDPKEVERRLVEGVPLKAPSFQVFLNGERVRPRTLSGHRIPVLDGTPYGPVHGEILVLPASAADPGPPGIEIKVKQVTVRRDLFGAEAWGRAAERRRGGAPARPGKRRSAVPRRRPGGGASRRPG